MGERSEVLRSQYAARFADKAEYRSGVWKIICSDFFSRYVPESSVILDLGAGWGEFINSISAAKKYAMDLNSATKGLLNQDVISINQDCSSAWPLESNSLNIVFTSNFLEHLDTKTAIENTITEANRCLVNGGLMICMGPNIKYLPGTYWDFWDHHIPLTEASCSELLAMKGFQVVLCLPRFLPYTMSGGLTPPLSFVRLYLLFPLLWRFFGKQFLVIGKKSIN